VELADPARPVIDLSAAMTALELAEFDLLLGEHLDLHVRSRIHHEVKRRCLDPYLTRHDFWWLYNTHARTVNNWTAVCTGGVVGAAIYLEHDVARLAEMITRAARSLDDYLATFDADGGSTEGPGYWSFGFGYYTILAHLVEHRTGGAVRLLDGGLIRNVAQFPLRTVLSPGRYVNFSDCDQHVRLIGAHLAYLARRLDLPDLMLLAQMQPPAARESQLTWALRRLFWAPDAPSPAMPRLVPAQHDFFREMHWMIARARPEDPDGLVLAAKGGHNGEMHNQNDVGSFIVHVRGESIVADLGRGRYTRDYFGPRRYEHIVNSSLGHSLPVPNGQAQRAGKQYAAAVLKHSATEQVDTLALDLSATYPPEADLESLRRRVTLHRERPQGWVELIDEFRFASRPGTLETALISFGGAQVVAEAGEVRLQGERAALQVRYDPAMAAARVEIVPQVDLAEGRRDVTRVVFSLPAPAMTGVIRLELRPAGT
jgi:hypothetical protein